MKMSDPIPSRPARDALSEALSTGVSERVRPGYLDAHHAEAGAAELRAAADAVRDAPVLVPPEAAAGVATWLRARAAAVASGRMPPG